MKSRYIEQHQLVQSKICKIKIAKYNTCKIKNTCKSKLEFVDAHFSTVSPRTGQDYRQREALFDKLPSSLAPPGPTAKPWTNALLPKASL